MSLKAFKRREATSLAQDRSRSTSDIQLFALIVSHKRLIDAKVLVLLYINSNDYFIYPYSLRVSNMPEISRFLGIIILMYFDEHNPPHFHIQYNEYRATMDIRSLNITIGTLPAKVRGLVEEWAEPHRDELLKMWESKEFHHIAPLV